MLNFELDESFLLIIVPTFDSGYLKTVTVFKSNFEFLVVVVVVVVVVFVLLYLLFLLAFFCCYFFHSPPGPWPKKREHITWKLKK